MSRVHSEWSRNSDLGRGSSTKGKKNTTKGTGLVWNRLRLRSLGERPHGNQRKYEAQWAGRGSRSSTLTQRHGTTKGKEKSHMENVG